jgi:hypothetical protein
MSSQPEIKTKVNPDMRTIFVTGFLGDLDLMHGVMHFFRMSLNYGVGTDPVNPIQPTERICELMTDIRMTPGTFKATMLFMKALVDRFEKAYGEIKLKPDGNGQLASKSSETRYT